ncbi:MAG: hypothetical protein ABL993_00960 [Vicinamibacterales bacterium]
MITIALALLRRFWPYLAALALVLATWAAYRGQLAQAHAQGYTAGAASVQAPFDAYVAQAEAQFAQAVAQGAETTRVLNEIAQTNQEKLNAELTRLSKRNVALSADNAGLHANLAAQAAAPRRTDSENTLATCRSDEERVRTYAGLLDEGARLVEEGEQSLQRCTVKLTALQNYAETVQFYD